jgi:hypothetical protein
MVFSITKKSKNQSQVLAHIKKPTKPHKSLRHQSLRCLYIHRKRTILNSYFCQQRRTSPRATSRAEEGEDAAKTEEHRT